MFGHSPIESDRDRRVKVLADNVAVSASTAQSEYARYLNFIGDRFTAVSNTVSGVKTYDIALKYADKIIPYEAGVAKGSTPGWLNFDGNHFDVSSLASDMYTVTSTGRVKVNAISTLRPLNVVNTTNHTAVTVADNSGTDKIDMTFSNDDVIVLSNGTVVNTTPRRVNFSTDFTATDNSGSDRVDIALATTTSNFLPNPLAGKKYGMMYGAQNTSSPSGIMAGDGLLNIPYTTIGGGNAISGGFDPTHGVYRRFTLGSDDNDAFKVMSGVDITNRSANPHLYGKMRFNVLEDHRFFCGFHTGTIPDNDDNFLNNLVGFGIGEQSDFAGTPNTHFQILRNDGGATTDKVSTGIAISAGTIFSFELLANNSTPNWQWNVNGGSFTSYNTEVPTTQDLRFTFQLEEIGSDEAVMDLFYLYWTQDL
jgi:hypothetical protein